MSERILKLAETLSMTRKGRTSMYDAIKANQFPQPVMLGKRAVGWRESDLIAWIESRPKRTNAK
jgi:prophage regulatory protein